jgi:hypothetical protein
VILNDCNSLKPTDIVCAKTYLIGYKCNGKKMLTSRIDQMFQGFAIVLESVDIDVSDPTCKIMLSCGEILRIKEERLKIAECKNETY